LTSKRTQIIKTWIAAVLWLVLIAIESTDSFSAASTSSFLYPIAHFLTGVDPLRFAEWNYDLRKVGHVVGYFCLSFFLFRAWRATIPVARSERWSVRWAGISFFMTALVAGLDEWHQTFIPSRTGGLPDVLLDSGAALAAQILIFLWFRRTRPGGERPAESRSLVGKI
jgi:VanZ family protein